LQGRGSGTAAPPYHVWEALAQLAPEAAELACQAADAASAAQYFAVRGPPARAGRAAIAAPRSRGRRARRSAPRTARRGTLR